MAQPNQHFPWTPEEEAVAKARWIEGQSASEIAKALPGRSRNAIIGIAYRSGWLKAGRAPASAPVRAPKVERTRVAPPKPCPQNKPGAVFGPMPTAFKTGGARVYPQQPNAPLPKAKASDVTSPNALPFLEAKRGCKWPIGDGRTMLSCCNPIVRGVYCEGHASVAFAQVQPTYRDRGGKAATYHTRHDRIAAPKPHNDNGDGLWDRAA